MRKKQSANRGSIPERRTDGRGASHRWAALVGVLVLAGLVVLAAAQVANYKIAGVG